MGKDKHPDHSDAFHRINFLYQASQLQLEVSGHRNTSAYYGYLAKEVAKKVVGKIHPELKKKWCRACCIPLREDLRTVETSVKKFKHVKRKKIRLKKLESQIINLVAQSSLSSNEIENEEVKASSVNVPANVAPTKVVRLKVRNNSVPRHNVRSSKPNILRRVCCNCGFERNVVMRPNHQLWIENPQSSVKVQ